MMAVVVYESLWGNTAAIARAIAEGTRRASAPRRVRSPRLRHDAREHPGQPGQPTRATRPRAALDAVVAGFPAKGTRPRGGVRDAYLVVAGQCLQKNPAGASGPRL